LAVLLGVVIAAPTQAQQEQQKPQERREHVVKRGDTLWDLAKTYLNNPFLWPLIHEANKEVVENPHWIYPKEKLVIVIPPLPGEKPDSAAAPAQPVIAPEPPPRAPAGPSASSAPGTRRTRFYAPPDTASLPTLLMAGAAAPQRVEPKEFHASPWLGDPGRLPVRGRIFKPADPRSEGPLLGTTFHPYDRLYISYEGRTRPNQGDLLLVVSVGRVVGGYGSLILPTGVVRVDSVHQGSMHAMITHQFGTLEIGNLVIPMDSFPVLAGEVQPVANGTEGKLIEFLVPQAVYGTEEIGFVSLGSAGGIKVGDELHVTLPARSRDDRIPAQPIAKLLVTRVTQRSSTVRVTHLHNPVLVEGLPVRLVARMP
jgi:hypothetical protein